MSELAPSGASLLWGNDDTIVAQATPPGRGAIALVRLSGPDALRIAGAVLRPWPLQERRATLCAAHETDSRALIDRPLVTVFQAPRSYTGEHLVELCTHGGYAAPTALIAALIGAGARLALQGEFTRRAVLNGKLDLIQAEAIGDLIDARSEIMRRTALVQLDGGLSRRLTGLRDALLEVEALLAYDIDFPEEDDGPVARERVEVACDAVQRSIDALIATAPLGTIVREGAIIVIAGAPNVGKSSLFNALAGEARAIVTDVAGTTRDALEFLVETGDWPLRLIDTAGLRPSTDRLERLGIEVSERYLSRAHLVLACGDDQETLAAALQAVRQHSDAPVVAVRTKADLVTFGEQSEPEISGVPAVSVSATTGEGLHELLDTVGRTLTSIHGGVTAETPRITRTRHLTSLRQARAEMAEFDEAWRQRQVPAPVAAIHVRSAIVALDELVGTVDVEDVLGRVFATFCVGK